MSNGDEDARYIQVATITQRSTVLVEAVIRGGTEKQVKRMLIASRDG